MDNILNYKTLKTIKDRHVVTWSYTKRSIDAKFNKIMQLQQEGYTAMTQALQDQARIELAEDYGITRDTELAIRKRGKWDVRWDIVVDNSV